MIYKPSSGLIAAGGFRNHPRYRGCVGHWLMVQGGGLTEFDISGFLNDGTLSGGTAWVGFQFGPALNFDGSDDVVTVGSRESLDDVVPISVTSWIYPTGWGGGGFGRVFSKTGAAATDNTRLYVGTGVEQTLNFYLNYDGGTSPTASASNSSILLNNWQFVAATFKLGDGGPRLFVNGVETGYAVRTAETGNKTTDASNIALIGNRGDGLRGFQGLIGDLRVYRRALTATDIASLYLDPFLEFRPPRKRGFSKSAVSSAGGGIFQGGIFGGSVLRAA